MEQKKIIEKMNLTKEIEDIISCCKKYVIPESRSHLISMAFGNDENDLFEVKYKLPGGEEFVEANVARCKNGAVINYPDDYMRRRDPDCLLVADKNDTDKPRYDDVYNKDFNPLREDTFEWLKEQELIIMPFKAGGNKYGYDALLVSPLNAAFFAGGLADLQGMIPAGDVEEGFSPKAVIYLAPVFRHTHFNGKQVVIHNRGKEVHELFSYNLYPGPSAKKGIYGVLLNIGENEGWITLHGSTVKVITPYDNEIIIMHEGASGGGKSEMIEKIHKEMDGRIKIGTNTVTNEDTFIELSETCELNPVTDDMALCHPDIQNDSKKLVITDAEQGWFLRLDHIKGYGTTPHYEKIFTQPSEPLIFLNLQGVPKSTCLVWEHTIDSDGKPCPNPRVILPRRLAPNVVNKEVEIDVRSFGIRAPACTKSNPTYGIIGMFHILPPALAWIWRLVAPRGHNNPSITKTTGMTSEGVGSYWPFATGKMVEQANLLLEQIIETTNTRYILLPNQHIGAYKVGFKPQWIAREYLARRGSARFKQEYLKEARCSILGYCLESYKVDGQNIRKSLLQPELQSKVGVEAYDKGADMLVSFFKDELKKFNVEELHPVGKQIIELVLNDAPLEDYINVLGMKY